jgi:hypothetical protein
MKPDFSGLKEAAEIEAKGWGWYKFISTYLLETSNPTVEQILRSPIVMPGASAISIRSNPPDTSRIIIAAR